VNQASSLPRNALLVRPCFVGMLRVTGMSGAAKWAGVAWTRALAGLLLALASPASLASAHAPPQVLDIAWQPDGAPVLVTNRGLILIDEPGQAHLVCTDALPVSSTEKPSLLVMPNGDFVVATARGLLRSTDRGCSFTGIAPLATLNTSAAVADPRDAAHFYVAAFDAERGGSLLETSDAGATFTTLTGPSMNDFVEALLVPPSMPERLYASGEVFDATGTERYVAHSDDGGASFTRFPLPLLATEGAFELLAVSPSDPDLLLGRAVDDDAEALQDRLLVSRDRGETWSSPIRVRALTSARFARGGDEVWVTGVEGAFRSRDGAQSFEPWPDAARISLALQHEDDVWLCGYYDGLHDGIARVDAAGTLSPSFAFTEVDEPPRCPESTPAISACALLWRDWQREILGIFPDAAVPMPDAAVPDSGMPEPTPPRRGGGCRARPSPPGGASSLAGTLAAALLALGARRKRTRARSR
jgi:hypothetical protein